MFYKFKGLHAESWGNPIRVAWNGGVDKAARIGDSQEVDRVASARRAQPPLEVLVGSARGISTETRFANVI